ncbi:MAG: MBL fold metallo-hydrolase [Halanaerobiales bacterium]
MKIYHLYHSGVAIDYQDCLLIFDYFRDSTEKISNLSNSDSGLINGVVRANDLQKYKEIYVFVSHNHSDHYNPVIFDWQDYNSNIKYILSDDLDAGKEKNIYYIQENDNLKLDSIEITAYGSTDQGISFLVKLSDKYIFHSGDLNWWHWSSFSDKQLRKEEKDFKDEVDKLKGVKIDIAFVPVDPRLGKFYHLAGEYFIDVVEPTLLIPIHFADQYKITEDFAAKFTDYSGTIAVIESPGTEITYH